MPENKTSTSNYLEKFMGAATFGLVVIILSKLFSYAYKIIAARYLGPADYGSFSIAFIFLNLAVIILSLGIPDGLLRIIPSFLGLKKKKKVVSLVKFSITLLLVIGLTFSVVLFLLADWINTSFFQDSFLATNLKILSFALPFLLITSLYLALIRSLEKAKTASFFMNIVPNALKFIFLIILIFLGAKSLSLPYSYALSFIFLAGTLVVYFRKSFLFEFKKNSNNEKIWAGSSLLFKYSIPLIFIGLLNGIFYWTDSLMLGHYVNSLDVGLYNAALTIISLFSIGPDLFVQLFLPVVSKETAKKNKDVVKNITKRISKWIYLVNLPILLIIIIFPSLMIDILFGPEFLAAKNALIILAFAGIVSSLATLSSNLLSSKTKGTVNVMYYLLIFSILNILLNFLLIPKLGMSGAATATAISWAFLSISFAMRIKKDYGFFPVMNNLPKITLVAIATGTLLLLMKSMFSYSIYGLFLAAIIFGFVYYSLLVVTKSLDSEDTAVFKRMLNSVTNVLRKKTNSQISPLEG